jgi:hypothetical protein
MRRATATVAATVLVVVSKRIRAINASAAQ